MAWNPPGKHSDPVDVPKRPRFDPREWMLGGSLLWTGLVLGAWLALSCVVMVGDGRQAVISRLGQPSRVVQSGVHFKLPWPLERATGIDIAARQSIDDSLPVVVGDPAMFELPLQIGYAIDDPIRYLSNDHEMVRAALQRMARDAVSAQVYAGSLATLGGRDGQLSAQGLAELQARVHRANLGVKPLSVTWAAPVLPGAGRDAGETLKSIQDDQARAITNAKASAEKQLPAAQAEADAMLAVAERDRAARVLDAQGDAAHFRALAAQYRASPIVTRDVVLQGALSDNAATSTNAPAVAATTPVVSAASSTTPVTTQDSVRPQRDDSRKVDRSVDRRRPDAGVQR